MTDTIDRAASGEARLRTRRNRIIRFCLLGFSLGIAIGFISGYASALLEDGTLPAWSLFVFWAAAMATFAWFSWEYFRRVDELDVLDNLWACLFGFYFYAAAMPSWWLFHDLGLAPEIDHFAIYFASGAVMFVAYGLRKLGLR